MKCTAFGNRPPVFSALTLVSIAACLAILLFFSTAPAVARYTDKSGFKTTTEAVEKETWFLEMYLAGLKNVLNNPNDVRIRIAENLKKVAGFQMSPGAFYEGLSRMEMPPGMEARHVLQAVKKDIMDFRGTKGMEVFFGSRFDGNGNFTEEQRSRLEDIRQQVEGKPQRMSGGGTMVERRLLMWRRQVVTEGIRIVLASAKGLDVKDGYKYNIYMAEIGSWSNESPENMRFAGDIDFSFLCGNLEIAMRLKQRFDAYIKKRVGLSPEAFDTPCTAHGMATDEVFIGKHGQRFAEEVLKVVRRVELGEGLGEKVNGQKALENALADAKFAKTPLTNLVEMKWPTEPGISLEMIRHFEHDIVHKGIYGDMDSFLKACKYLQRSARATAKLNLTPANDALTQFADTMMALKEAVKTGSASQGNMVEAIRAYFDTIGNPFPYDIRLGPQNTEGQSKVQIEAKETVIKTFWDDCTKAMHTNAVKGFKRQFNDFRQRFGALPRKPGKELSADERTEIKNLAVELQKMREMLEIEMRVLGDPDVGIKEIPPELDKMVNDFRNDFKQFMQEHGAKALAAELKKGYTFIDEMLKANRPSALHLAMGALVTMPERINAYVDILDDTLLGKLRGDGGQTWQEYLSGAPNGP